MSQRFKDFEHLLRLAAVFAAGLLLFVVVRAQVVPDDFGRYGHYRASAVDAARHRPLVHAGESACAECHEEVVGGRSKGLHVAVACETCHGPRASHVADPAVAGAKPDDREACVRCHAANTGKPKWFRTVEVAEHAGDEACTSCHEPHIPCESPDGDVMCESGPSRVPGVERP